MSSPWFEVWVFGVVFAVFWWALWVWSILMLELHRRRGLEPNRTQVEAREWPAAIAIGFSGLALLAWFRM